MNVALRVFYILVFLYYSLGLILPIKTEIINSIPFLNKFIRLLCNGFFVAYIIEIIINLKKGKPINVNRHIWWLIAFLLCATISCFYNKEYELGSNLKWVKWYALFFSIFLTINNKVTLKDNINTFLIVSDVITAVGAIGCLWSLGQFVTSYSGSIVLYNETIPQGLFGGRLSGVYYNANPYAVLAFVSMSLSFILFHFRKNKIAKSHYIISSICYFFIVLLTGSRTSLYSFTIIVSLISVFYCNRIVVKNKFYKVVGLIVVGVLSALVFYEACNIVKKSLFYLPYFYQKIACYSKNDPVVAQGLTLQKPVERPAFTLSSRDIIWKEYLEIWKTSPWFGIGPQNSMTIAKERLNDSALIVRRNFAPHNEFLYLLVSVGIIGVIPFVVWLGLTSFDILKYLYKNRHKDSSLYFLSRMLSCIVVYFIISGLAENIVFWCEGWLLWSVFTFFYISGNVIYLSNQDETVLFE